MVCLLYTSGCGSLGVLFTLTALGHGVGHGGGDQADGADGVIVAGDDIVDPVSYTHLDVYKRQVWLRAYQRDVSGRDGQRPPLYSAKDQSSHVLRRGRSKVA